MLAHLKYAYYKRFPGEIPDELGEHLSRTNTYYAKLNSEARGEFEFRTHILMRSLTFKGMKEIIPSSRMKTIIASALTQLTFGFSNYFFPAFSTIIISPRSYNHASSDVAFLGHTDPYNGSITLSWPHVKSGYKIEDDSKNLALHELSHGLLIQYHESPKGRFYGSRSFNSLKNDARRYMTLITSKKITFIRAYGATNFMEFFACTIEAFFENGDVFKSERPTFYNQIINILNQDPLNESDPREYSK